MCAYIYIYICIHTHLSLSIHIYIYIRTREPREPGLAGSPSRGYTRSPLEDSFTDSDTYYTITIIVIHITLLIY